MIKHIVWFTITAEEGSTKPETLAKIKEMLEGLRGKIPSLNSMEVSLNRMETTTVDFDFILQTTHDDAAGLKAYAEHPEHVKCVEFIKTVVVSRAAIDYEI